MQMLMELATETNVSNINTKIIRNTTANIYELATFCNIHVIMLRCIKCKYKLKLECLKENTTRSID